MENKPRLSIDAFDYELPDKSIAFHPIDNRSDSKLLVWDQSIIANDQYKNIDRYIPSSCCLVFNNSKVIPARIFFEKPSDKGISLIEIFCLEPSASYLPITKAMEAKGQVNWICLVGGAKKWKEDNLQQKIKHKDAEIIITATKIKHLEGKFEITFSWNHEQLSFSELLHIIGKIPLPPYIQREANSDDVNRYQTTYASIEGSVAAPTAGLHFDQTIFNKLTEKSIQCKYLTLHVGAGTFMPVKTTDIAEHTMHGEFIEVDTSFIYWLANASETIISVGTTSLRTLESLYWMGCKIIENEHLNENELALTQWEAYRKDRPHYSKQASLLALYQWLTKRKALQLITSTQLIIVPGYQFKVAKGLISNFHQPKSTLLLIMSAIMGPDWREVYAYALSNEYRFLSYGDGGLYWIKQ